MLEERSTGNPYATFGEGWGAGFPSSPRLLCIDVVFMMAPSRDEQDAWPGNVNELFKGMAAELKPKHIGVLPVLLNWATTRAVIVPWR